MTQLQDQNTDPRIAAKAQVAYEKAAAKASRPWFRKKRFVIPLGLVVVVVLAQSMSGGEDEGGAQEVESAAVDEVAGTDGEGQAEASADEGAAEKEQAKPGSAERPLAVGKTVELEGTRYTVDGARTTPTVGPEFVEEQADGVFVVVDLTIENTKNESKIFMDSAAEFVTQDGASYGTDSDASFASAEESLLMTEMHPDLPTSGQLIFDVPPAKVKGGTLEVSDLFGGGEAYLALGLE